MFETEVFLEAGSWRSYDDLEDCLTLDELLKLYEGVNIRQSRLMKTVASALGAEFEDDGQTFGPESGPVNGTIRNAGDASALPIGLGYERKE